MGIATHLGPWLLGTVKDTTGTTSGTIRNVGATDVTQTAPLATNSSGTLMALPAGAMILEVALLTTTAFSGGTTPTVTLSIGGTAITNAISLGAVGRTTATIGAASATAAGLVNNVGATDALVTVAVAGAPTAGAGVIVVTYLVRNPDGTIANVYAFGPAQGVNAL